MPNSNLEPLFSNPLFLSFFACILAPMVVLGTNSNHFSEYIGAQFKEVKFSDVPINSGVEFHYILSFAIDYSVVSTPPIPSNGKFGVFWDTQNLSPSAVSAIKKKYSNVKVAVSLGGATIVSDKYKVYFKATSVDSWVSNAVSSLTSIIKEYNLDGIDIDYENFSDESDTGTFTECIGLLITTLKRNGVISFASIAPFDDTLVQRMYKALWAKYSSVIDYVNFQFYGYDADTTVKQYVTYYDEQVANYPGGRVLASFMTENTAGVISADRGFSACQELKKENKLYGIFIWSADDSLSQGFTYEKESQALLTS
ncbi:Chitinase 2 [Rhynchospora pubera]|uniref:Chitinase 2 n=1 Tax=Rhynchospora pubera TaxID=906938 RepID=A0AAV8C5A1_9POAL|nr:Chitinase 2 [Rhynchospora pubera]